MYKQVKFRGEFVWGLGEITDRFEAKSVGFILEPNKTHKTLLLVLTRFSGKMPLCVVLETTYDDLLLENGGEYACNFISLKSLDILSKIQS